MKRRWFLSGALGLVLHPRFSFAQGGIPTNIDREMTSLADRLLVVCPKQSSAVAVGKAYLEELPSLPKVSRLVEDLICNLGTTSSQLKVITPLDLRARYRGRLSEDFSAGRTIRLHGWVLGDTEAKLCALAARRSDQEHSAELIG